MDEAPPSYSQATARDHWSLISPYVASRDLYSAALVCRRWNRIFTPLLWRRPTSHFSLEHDDFYAMLARFMRTLAYAHASNREVTRTLCFPSASAEIHEGPRAEWLRNMVSKLPNLQSLVVAGCPYFDHQSLTSWISLSTEQKCIYPLRLLDAAACLNCTPPSLAGVLKMLPNLVYLDLSRTPTARHLLVFKNLESLSALQILKVRGLGLNDDDLAVIVQSIGRRVRSLDVRDNRLTNRSARLILQACIITPDKAQDIVNRNAFYFGGTTSHSQMGFGHELSAVFKTNSQDTFVRRRLIFDFCDHLGIEVALETGLTHLYISGNSLSVSAVTDLLRMQRLHVLDVGSLYSGSPTVGSSATLSLPALAIERLIPFLDLHGSVLIYLRLGHQIITELVAPQSATNSSNEDSDASRSYQKLLVQDKPILHNLDVAQGASHKSQDDEAPAYESKDPCWTPNLRTSQSRIFNDPFTLHPGMLPQLETLVLSDVPTHWPNRDISSRIIEYISACAKQSHWTKLRARNAHTLNLGRVRRHSEQVYAKDLFQLRKIVLEMKPTVFGQDASMASNRSAALSAVEDSDCENLWQAASEDFSFFTDEEYEISESANDEFFEARPYKMAIASRGRNASSHSQSSRQVPPHAPLFDVLAEIARFRTEKKAAYQAAISKGLLDPYMEGYWEGNIVIVRNPKN